MKREFEDFRNHEKYGTEFHSKYKWGGARLNNDKYATSSTGYRYVPRDPNSAIKSNEVKGWLHCWCQTKNLGKPESESCCTRDKFDFRNWSPRLNMWQKWLASHFSVKFLKIDLKNGSPT